MLAEPLNFVHLFVFYHVITQVRLELNISSNHGYRETVIGAITFVDAQIKLSKKRLLSLYFNCSVNANFKRGKGNTSVGDGSHEVKSDNSQPTECLKCLFFFFGFSIPC